MEPAKRITLVSAGDTVELAPDGGGEPAGWGRYVAAVAEELATLGREPVGIAGVVEADLPQGAGLGSSGALEVAVGLRSATSPASSSSHWSSRSRASARSSGRSASLRESSTRRPPCWAAIRPPARLWIARAPVDRPARAAGDHRCRLGRAARARRLWVRRPPAGARGRRPAARSSRHDRKPTRSRDVGRAGS